jgi:hypothetical protein
MLDVRLQQGVPEKWRGDNGAGRVGLYGPDGLPLSREDGSSMGGAQGIVTMVVNDNIARFARGDRFGSAAIATHQPLLHEDFEGTTINLVRWAATSSTMVATQSNNGWILNSGNSVVANAYISYVSNKRFAKMQRSPLGAKFRKRLWNVVNTVADFGWGLPNTNVVNVPNGAYFQKQAAGSLLPILSYNGSPVATGDDIMPALLLADGGLAAHFIFDIIHDDEEVRFIVQRADTEAIISEQTLRLSNAQAKFTLENHMPVFDRLINANIAPVGPAQSWLADVYVYGLDQFSGKTFAQTQVAMGKGSNTNPASGVQLANFTNSAAPANATLSNAAAGYSALHGLFSFAAVAGAPTDYALFGLQIPGGYQFLISEITIDTWNTGVAGATTSTLLEWFIATEGSAISLATANYLREHIGTQSLPVGIAPGANANQINRSFQSPISCNPGRFVVIGLRMPVSTATASQVIQGAVSVRGIFE